MAATEITKSEPKKEKQAAKAEQASTSARQVDAVDYPVVVCIGCNSADTVRIGTNDDRHFHLRQCRSCGKKFKEPMLPKAQPS